MIRARRHAHRGSVIAVGVAIDPALIGEAEARRRVIAAWAPGADVRAAAGVWIVRTPAARRVRIEDAAGAPLVRTPTGALTTLPLARGQHDELAAGTGAVIVARAGRVEVIAPGAGDPIDPADWLALDDVPVAEVTALAAPVVVAQVPIATTDVRAVLGVGAAHDGAAEVRAALARALRGEPAHGDTASGQGAATAARSTVSTGAVEPAPPGVWSRLRGWFGGKPAATRTVTTALAERATLPPPSLFDRMRARLSHALWRSPLGRTIGKRHADYLRETLEMFDRGELDEALRRAIAIGGGDRDGPTELALGTPARRTNLSPSLQRAAGTSTIPVIEDAIALLRARYEAARDRLLRDGRHEEAAFVVADLLGDPAAAVALLERHGKHRLAAELAEARGLDPALVVRQWFLAGEPARAAALAWRTGTFADAVARAAHRDPELAEGLRLLWARALADAGDHARAVEVARRARERPAELPAWIALGIAGGGVAAARLQMWRVELEPERFAEARDAAISLFERTDDESLPERIAAAGALTSLAPGDAAAALARPAVRAMVGDIGRGVDGEPAVFLPRLVRLAADPALRTDLPTLSAFERPAALVDRERPSARRWARADAGTAAVRDAALLPGGRLVVALGELGVRLLGRDGRVIGRWDEPADALVVSDAGTRAIAVATRGKVRRLARLDLATKRARPWCETELDAFTTSYDGRLWLVAARGSFLALDTTREGARAAWGVQVDDGWLGLDLARAEEQWLGAVSDVGSTELWQYDGLTMRGRKALPKSPDGRWPESQRVTTAFALNPDGGGWAYARMELRPDGDGGGLQLARDLITPDNVIALTLEPWRPLLGDAYGHVHDPDTHVRRIVAAGRFVALAWRAPAWGTIAEVWYLPARRRCAIVALEGAEAVSMRLDDLCLTCGDDLGRVIVVDLRTGVVRRDLRIGP